MAEITLAATIDNIAVVTDFVSEQLDELGCSMKVQMQFSIAVDELFSNIAHYAYPSGEGMATVQLSTQADGKQVVLTFIDEGIPYDPLAKEDPDITLALDDRPIGGLGIFMVKKTMDDMQYRYEDGKNILRIIKSID